MKKEAGPCSESHLRFYWSDADHECRPFTYGGCEGNDNNFISQEDCYETCGGELYAAPKLHSPTDCSLSAEAGPCEAADPRWYFDSAVGDCLAFYYGGCAGNGNNFLGYEDCVTFCRRDINEEKSKFILFFMIQAE